VGQGRKRGTSRNSVIGKVSGGRAAQSPAPLAPKKKRMSNPGTGGKEEEKKGE